MDVLNIYAIGSVMSGKHLFFDTLNIKFREQDGLTKIHFNDYSYKEKMYKYLIYFISGEFNDPELLPAERQFCDAVLFLLNPLITDVFKHLENMISNLARVHPQTLVVLIMQNVFGELENLPPEIQEIALLNGMEFFEIENSYNLKVISLNYDQAEIESLESGDSMAYFKFFKMFNEAFYDIIHECIERHEKPTRKLFLKLEEGKFSDHVNINFD